MVTPCPLSRGRAATRPPCRRASSAACRRRASGVAASAAVDCDAARGVRWLSLPRRRRRRWRERGRREWRERQRRHRPRACLPQPQAQRQAASSARRPPRPVLALPPLVVCIPLNGLPLPLCIREPAAPPALDRLWPLARPPAPPGRHQRRRGQQSQWRAVGALRLPPRPAAPPKGAHVSPHLPTSPRISLPIRGLD